MTLSYISSWTLCRGYFHYTLAEVTQQSVHSLTNVIVLKSTTYSLFLFKLCQIWRRETIHKSEINSLDNQVAVIIPHPWAMKTQNYTHSLSFIMKAVIQTTTSHQQATANYNECSSVQSPCRMVTSAR